MSEVAMLIPGYALVVSPGANAGACKPCAQARLGKRWTERRVPAGLDAYADAVLVSLREAAAIEQDTDATVLLEYDFSTGFVRREWMPPTTGCTDCRHGLVAQETQLLGADTIDIPTHLAEAPFFFRVVESQRLATPDLGSSGAGKAASYADLTARGEYMERAFSSLHSSRIRCASYAELDSPHSPLPSDYARYAEFQHARPGFPYPRFTNDLSIGWTLAVDLSGGPQAYVPAQYTVFPYELEPSGDRYLSDWNTTGLSYGPDRRFAERGGLLEALERDGIAITWLNRLPRARIRCPEFESQIAPGVELYFIDITTNAPVSSVMCFSVRRGGGPILAMSASCALEPRRAIEKAFAENLMCIELAEYLRLYEKPPTALDDFDAHAALYAHGNTETIAPLRFLLEPEEEISFEAWSAKHPEISFEDAVAGLAAIGMRPYSIDLTPPWMGGNQAINRVIIPSAVPLHAHHERPFLGGARLREVPLALGYAPFELEQGVIPHALP